MLFQDDALLPWKTARDNVALGLDLPRLHAQERAGAGRLLARPARARRLRAPLSAPPQRRPAQARRAGAGAGADAEAPADGRAVRLARRHRARPHHPGRRRAGRRGRHQRAAGHPRPRRGDQPVRPRLPALAGAARAHHAANTRCRSRGRAIRCKARMHPAFAPLYEKLWNDLSHEVDVRSAAPRRRNDAHRSALRLAAPARRLRHPARCSGRRPAAPACSIRCSCRARAASARRSTSCSRTAASGRISKRPSPPRWSGSRSASWSASCSASSPRWSRRSPSCSSR